ncbi:MULTISPECIES: arginine repressor [Lactococcus]|uniref:Arginine repressor n=2 Tax=Lactococcus TaxID=1357 RepID=A0A387BBS1_9LACT|nr:MULTISPECIES: arginine repressor [Lactococcus]AYG01295.1 arginine repressor [Lactococcus allomyrinae]MCL2114063.1 arginine repressor [Streptococcaceae bacterium]QDK70136.1 arginine repressor [Lactococcus protaetiae]
MKRNERLNLIKEIISKNQVATQENLQEILEAEGVSITQATLSRDIREMNIIKKRRDGKSFYSFLDGEDGRIQSELQLYFSRFVIKVASSSVMVVVHTRLGEADLLANALDAEEREEILGTLAGADTLLVTCVSEAAARALVVEIENVL